MNTLEFTKIIGSPSESASTQLHDFDLPQGKLLIITSVTQSDTTIARMETIRGIVNFLHHEISENFNFEEFRTKLERSVSNPPFDILLFYKQESAVYIFALGMVQAFLVRDNKDFPLIHGASTVHATSGKVKEGDVFLIGTTSFFESIPVSSILEYYHKRQLENLETDFEVAIEKAGNQGLVGGAVIRGAQESVVLDEEVFFEEQPSSEDTVETSTLVEETNQTKPSRPLFLRRHDVYEARGVNKKATTIGAVLLLLLAVGIFFGFRAKKEKDEKSLVTQVLQDAKESLSQARAISLINKSKARELIYNAQQSVLGISTKENRYPEVKGVRDEIEESLGNVGGIYTASPETFSDLTLVTSNMKADDIAISEDTIAVLGKAENRVLTISLPGKRTETVNGSGSFSNPQKITLYSGRVFVWESSGIKEYAKGHSSVNPSVSGESGLVHAFAGNLYVVDPSKNQIFRYSGSESGFHEGVAWISETASVDLSGARSMAIDGSIWIFSRSGKITRFMLGNPQSVSLQGLDAPLSENASIYTSDEQKGLYVLDPVQHAVYVFEKTGEFIAKYQNDSLESATNLVVSESQKIMVLSANSKLLSISLKHLK